MANDEIVSSAEASRLLVMKQDKVTRLCRERKLPNATQDGYGQPWHIPLSDIEA